MLHLTCTIKRPAYAQDFYVPVPLNFSYLPQGKDQEIERYIAQETVAAMPAVVDKELVRMRLDTTDPGNARRIRPYFYNSNAQGQQNDYLAAGLNQLQIKTMSQGLARSMYIFEIYDSNDADQRTLLSRSFAKANDVATYEPQYAGATLTTNYPLLQFIQADQPTPVSFLSLPAYFLAANPTGTVYLQLSFFNSHTGKRIQLKNSAGESTTTGQNTSTAEDYIPLSFTAATRRYHLPPPRVGGSSLHIEEKLVGNTSVSANQARIAQNSTADRSLGQAQYQPLVGQTLPSGAVKFPPVSV
jgi:hypothetical protein